MLSATLSAVKIFFEDSSANFFASASTQHIGARHAGGLLENSPYNASPLAATQTFFAR
jgi:hypothetical protein